MSIVEEPIEFPLDKVAQVQVSESLDSTLASAVRAALGGRANVVIAGISLDAPTLAQCGTAEGRARLMIASLDTLDMPSTLARLQILQPDSPLLAGMLEGVVAQRLLRRLCPECAAPQSVNELPELQQRLLYGLPMAKLRRPVGCPECRTTGYLGRTAIAEVVPMVPAMRQALADGASMDDIALIARENGMSTLWDSGMSRVLDGLTSLAELLDTVAPPAESGGEAPQEDIDALLAQLLGSPHMQPVAASGVTPPVKATAPEAPAAPLPPAATPVSALPVLSAMASSRNDASTISAGTPIDAIRVLLVDDDSMARRTLAKQLTDAGFQVLQAADGSAALEFAKRLRPDIILTEVAVPRLDAAGLLAELASESMPFTVVVHTAQWDEALHQWLREAGARDILPRDMPIAELIDCLRELAR